MKNLILLLLAGCAFGQTVATISVPKASHSDAFLQFSISGYQDRLRTRFTVDPVTCSSGTGGAIQMSQYQGPIPTSDGVNAGIVLSGLTPGTHYHACIELSSNGGSSWISSGASGMVDVYTQALDPTRSHPYLPTPPQSFTNVSYPDTSKYHVYALSSCSDLMSTFSTAVDKQQTEGAVITLPAGTNCSASDMAAEVYRYTWVFSKKQPDILNTSFSSASNTVSIPGATAAGWGNDGRMVRFQAPNHAAFPSTNTVDCGGGQIAPGELYWLHPTATPDTFAIYCNASAANGGTRMVLADSGSQGATFWSYPAPRDSLNWIVIRTATPDAQFAPQDTRVSPVWASKMVAFTNAIEDLSNPGHNTNRALFTVGDPDGANPVPMGKIWFSGLEFANPSYTSFSPDPNSWYPFIWTNDGDGDVVFDRCYFHSTEPGRVSRLAVQFDGSDVGIINSYADGISYWQPGRLTADYLLSGISATDFTISAGRTGTAYGVHQFTSTATFHVTPNGGSGWVEVGYDLQNKKTGVSAPSGFSVSIDGGGVSSYSTLVSNNANGSCNNSDPGLVASSTSTWAPISCVHYTNGAIDNGVNGNPWCSLSGDTHQGCGTSGVAGIVAGNGPGPWNFSNNFFQATGLFLHFDDSGGRNNFNKPWSSTHWRNRNDFTIYRNTFQWPRGWMFGTSYGDPANGGNYEWYGGRQPLEWKGGNRILVKGNIFDGTYTDGTNNNTVPTLTATSREINDVEISYNTIKHANYGLSAIQPVEGSIPQPFWLSNREYAHDNLAFDINGQYACSELVVGCGLTPPSGGPGSIFEGPYGTEDLIIDHNTVVGQTGTDGLVWLLEDGPVEGVKITNNIMTVNSNDGGPAKIDGQVIQSPCGYTGKGVIDCMFPNMIFGGNLWLSNTTNAAQFFSANDQAGNYFIGNDYTLPGWFDCDNSGNSVCAGSNSDFHLAHRAKGYKSGDTNHATDGRDVGADIDALNANQGLVVLNGATPTATAGQYSINYVAPDSASCSVDYSTSDSTVVNTFTRLQDIGGARSRNVLISGLPAKTTVHYRVNCAAQQPNGVFATN